MSEQKSVVLNKDPVIGATVFRADPERDGVVVLVVTQQATLQIRVTPKGFFRDVGELRR